MPPVDFFLDLKGTFPYSASADGGFLSILLPTSCTDVFADPVIPAACRFTRNTSLIRSGFRGCANTGFLNSIGHHLPNIDFVHGHLRNDHVFSVGPFAGIIFSLIPREVSKWDKGMLLET